MIGTFNKGNVGMAKIWATRGNAFGVTLTEIIISKSNIGRVVNLSGGGYTTPPTGRVQNSGLEEN